MSGPSYSDKQQMPWSQVLDPSRSSLASQLHRCPRPGRVQTNLCSPPYSPPLHQHPIAVSVSTLSASSVASSSRQGSPGMSPDAAALLTLNSSIQASPDAIQARDEDHFASTFQLPDCILSRKTSANSISRGCSPVAESVHGSTNGCIPFPTSTTASACSNNASSAPALGTSTKSGLMRRLSSKASRRITNRRRQSSAAPASRDGSIGPCYLRLRSDSNTTAPPEFLSALSDSESDFDEREDFVLQSTHLDAVTKGSSANSTTGSIAGSVNNMGGPLMPLQLQRGTQVKKISKKNRSKRVCLFYEPETNRLTWDRSRPQKFLHVDEIREIRTGSDIQQYARDFNIPQSERPTCFSILYTIPEKSKTKFLHLIADDIETCLTWTAFLDAILKHRQEVMTHLMTLNDRAIAQFWQSEMARQFGDQPRKEEAEELDLGGVMRVCQNLHIYSSQSTLVANFRRCDVRSCERLNFAQFLNFVRLMRQRPDVQRIMRSIAAKPDVGLTLHEFLAFLRNVQEEDVGSNKAMWERQFARLVRKQRAEYAEGFDSDQHGAIVMSEAAFVGFLSSRLNGPLVEEPHEYTLDRPMNEYFISSSHNTYLLGRQVAGQSSVEGYISALSRGCRCVEVDCWDGSDGQPQVVHGRTLTTAISFKEVMTTINKYAFSKSSFPLWISLEVHCCAAQQALMVDIMKEAFGSRLVTAPLDATADKLPSPSELMERILIKVKKYGGDCSEVSGRKRGGSLSSPLSRPTVPDGAALSPLQSPLPQSPLLAGSSQARRLVSKSRVNTITEGEVPELMSSSTSDNESGSEIGPGVKSANKTTKVLGALGVYCAGVKYYGFDSAPAKTFNHIFSFMEASFAKHSRTKEAKMALDIHNMRYMMRVYPDGIRVGSSNFDPLIYWRRGVQMAALNWQTFDLGSQLNQAMFEGGKDESGYVLKPPELRDIQVRPFDFAIAQGKKERAVVSFGIDVISAQQLMRPVNLSANRTMDPYVEIEVFHANDKRDKKEVDSTIVYSHDSPLKFSTEVVRENGFNPLFSSGPFRFKVTTKHPELIFVRWSVKLASVGDGRDGPPIATFMAKLKNLRNGYRTLPLLNHAGDQYLFSTLFCKIDVDPIETRLFDEPPPPSDVSKLNRLGGKMFGRGGSSPRSTIEASSLEKMSFDS
ncbi:hypothetical protein CDD81_1859 [Ophiocordyceps australis]|uniref:Phosphoinositide phospholipase C n=1 Tax=Ophiocordyceps australis TaxID=1399860 RepID=A0A2C5Y006_9HYPO|nr:hypothetical protein CDD81_1859 [Ophiocordyceps australis]